MNLEPWCLQSTSLPEVEFVQHPMWNLRIPSASQKKDAEGNLGLGPGGLLRSDGLTP